MPWKRALLYGIGQGLLIILGVWSGFIGGWWAVQAFTSGMCECVAVVAVHVSLPSRLRSAAVDLLEKIN